MRITCLALPGFIVLQIHAADWTQFRGPNGRGVSRETGLPVKWSASENIIWKTPLPGYGSSSPITIGKNIFLTCYTGYGQGKENRGEKKNLRHHVICLERDGGKIRWDKSIPTRKTPRIDNATDYVSFTALHGYASSTPVSDGKAVFAFFGDTGVIALDLNGQPLWTNSVGTKTSGFGAGPSPILSGNLLIVNASIESEALVALDKTTGREVWRAPDIVASWNTPVLVEATGGRKELVLMTKFKVLGFDPTSGKALWNSAGIRTPMYVCPSATTFGEVVYAVNGYHGPAVAVRSGGTGDVTATRQLWSLNKGSTVSSPAYHDGHLYWANDQGFAICVSATTGKLAYNERIEPYPKDVYASTVIADGKIYYVSRKNGTYVYAAQPRFQLLAHNVIADDESVFNASPAVTDKGLLLRSDKFLYFIGNQ